MTEPGSLTALTRVMELEVSGTSEWDLPPDVIFIYEDTPGEWQLSRMKIPSFIWRDDPAGMLFHLGDSLAGYLQDNPDIDRSLENVRPPGFRGMAFISEVWMVTQKMKDDSGNLVEPDPVLKAMMRERMLYQHPARREMRLIIAALKDGTIVKAWQSRDGMPVDDGYGDGEGMPAAGSLIISPDDPGYATLEGRIPEALITLTRALAHQ